MGIKRLIGSCFVHATGHVGLCGARCGVVINNHRKVARAVVSERLVERDERPVVNHHRHFAGESLVIGCRSNPVGLTGELALVSMHQVQVKIAGLLGTAVVEANGGDEACSADLIGSVDLLRQGILVVGVGRQVGVRFCAALADNDALLESGNKRAVLEDAEAVGQVLRDNLVVLGPAAEVIARVGSGCHRADVAEGELTATGDSTGV